jgi:hypothetical protein
MLLQYARVHDTDSPVFAVVRVPVIKYDCVQNGTRMTVFNVSGKEFEVVTSGTLLNIRVRTYKLVVSVSSKFARKRSPDYVLLYVKRFYQ